MSSYRVHFVVFMSGIYDMQEHSMQLHISLNGLILHKNISV